MKRREFIVAAVSAAALGAKPVKLPAPRLPFEQRPSSARLMMERFGVTITERGAAEGMRATLDVFGDGSGHLYFQCVSTVDGLVCSYYFDLTPSEVARLLVSGEAQLGPSSYDMYYPKGQRHPRAVFQMRLNKPKTGKLWFEATASLASGLRGKGR